MQTQRLTNRLKSIWSELEDRPSLAIALLLGLSLIIKGVLIFQAEIINPDGIRYINSAHELFQGDISSAFSHEKMLGFTFLLGLTHLFVSDWFLAGKILSCVALILTTIPLYLVAKEIFGTRAALFTAFAFTVAPSVNSKCDSVIKDPFFLFLIVLALCLMIYALNGSRLHLAFMAGSISCLSVLIRPEGIVFLLSVALFLGVSLVFLPSDRPSAVKLFVSYCAFPLGGLLLAAVMFAVGIVPLEVLPKIYAKFSLYFQTDLTQSYRGIYQHLKDVEETFPGGQWTNDYFELARYYILPIYLLGIIQIFCETLFPAFLLPLAFGLSLKGVWKKPLFLSLMVLVSFLLMNYIFILSRNFLSSRYLLVPVVLTFIWVGYGMDRMSSILGTVRFKKLFFVVSIVLFLVLPVTLTLYNNSEETLEIKQAGLWLYENSSASRGKMIVNEERIAYYAGLFRNDYHLSHAEKFNEMERKALKLGAERIVTYSDKNEVADLSVSNGFELVKTFPGRRKIVSVYERKI